MSDYKGKKKDSSFIGYEVPVDVDNESVVISTMLGSDELREFALRKLSFEQFRSPETRTIFWSINEIVNKKLELNVDMILVQANYCPARTVLTFDAVDRITKNFPVATKENVEVHIEKLVTDDIKSKVLNSTINNIVKNCMDPSKKVMDVQESVQYLTRTLDSGRSASICEFRSLAQLTPQFLEEKEKGIAKRTTGFAQLDHVLTDGLKEKTITIIAGLCLSGDSEIYVSRGLVKERGYRKYKLSYLYEHFNNMKGLWNPNITTEVMALNSRGIFQRHPITSVIYSGNKEVFEVVTKSGKTIKTSKDHKFKSTTSKHADADGFTPLRKLSVGDSIMVRDLSKGTRAKVRGRKKRKIVYSIPFHRYGVQHIIAGRNYKRANVARINYEAHLNGMTFDEFIKILRTDEDKAKKLKYLDPIYDVHHIDGNPENDEADNYSIMTHEEHALFHAKERDFSHNKCSSYAIEDEIVSITSVGVEPTYDIICDDPIHNFVANDFVVHNSGMGKSSLALSMIKNLGHKQIPTGLFALEMNNMSVYTKLLAYGADVDVQAVVKPIERMSTIERELFENEIIKMSKNKLIYINDKPQQLKIIEQQTMMLQDLLRREYVPVFIDLFGKIKDLRGSDNLARDYEHHLNETQEMAKRLNVPLILVAQINRAVMQRKNKRPTMQDIKNAGAFEEVADLILGVHRPNYNPEEALEDEGSSYNYWEDNSGFEDEFQVHHNNMAVRDPSQDIAEVIVMKQRNGRGNRIVNFYFNPKNTCYEPITRQHQHLINQTKDFGEGSF